MLVSIENSFGNLWVTITPNHEWYYSVHMYTNCIYEFETLGM